MKIKYNFTFVLALFISIGAFLACGKLTEMADKETEKVKEKVTEEVKKESAGNEETKTEDTRTTSRSAGGRLYFCEDYINGEEIGVSDRFTTGWLTVMVRTDEPLGVGKVELRLSKVKDSRGNSISEKIVTDIPFNVQPDWDYTYFQDKKKLSFKEPGTYKATLLKPDGSPIVSGEVEITSR